MVMDNLVIASEKSINIVLIYFVEATIIFDHRPPHCRGLRPYFMSVQSHTHGLLIGPQAIGAIDIGQTKMFCVV